MPIRQNDGEELIKERSRGADAERILADPLVIEVLGTMEARVFDGIKDCPIRDDEGLKNLRLLLKVIEDFRQNFRTIIETGKMADIQIRQDEKVTLE
jgi:hypothetical protein